MKRTSETVSAKRRITQLIAQLAPGSWAGNSKCSTPVYELRLCRGDDIWHWQNEDAALYRHDPLLQAFYNMCSDGFNRPRTE